MFSKKKRIQIELGPTSLKRLDRMKQTTEAASYAEVLRHALQLYDALIEEHEAGHSFWRSTPDNPQPQPYRMFIDTPEKAGATNTP